MLRYEAVIEPMKYEKYRTAVPAILVCLIL